jgi:uncharacterized protein YkwD
MIKTRLKCVMALLVATLTGLTFACGTLFANGNLSDLTYFNSASFLRKTSDEKRILQMVNEERAKYRAGSLVWDSTLASVARSYSNKMASENFFSHKDRTGKGLVERLKDADVTNWTGLAENLYFCQGFDDPLTSAVAGWMKSSGHRTNLLNSSWKSSGIGMAKAADGKVYVTQIFMR